MDNKYKMLIFKVLYKVGIITLNRPRYLNALCQQLMDELNHLLLIFDKNPNIGAIVITGSDKSFAAGADIKELKSSDFENNYRNDLLGDWLNVTKIRKPIIAAVRGVALGGGCELAMMCDIIYAGQSAKFGQPEVKLGVIPGVGGTQRLTRAIGKAKAMDLILTGSYILTSTEAEKAGLVAKIFPDNEVLNEAIKTAEIIASRPKIAIQMSKEAINSVYELPLSTGLQFERRLFHSAFATVDQTEGMEAFVEKRLPNFNSNL